MQEVEKRIAYLQKIISEKENAETMRTVETINVSSVNGKTQYYLNYGGERKYLRDSEISKVKELCQNDYDIKVLKAARKELKYLEKIKSMYQGEVCEAIYEKQASGRKAVLHPIYLPDNEYIKQWEAVSYDRKSFREGAPEYYTDKGERVRSKTEIIIANMLKKHNIPYRYECPMYLKGYGTIHPDFTVLNMKERKEMYLEHMGMMDDEEYREEALRRINAYEQNGIFPGDRLVLTHETRNNPVSSLLLEKIVCHYFL